MIRVILAIDPGVKKCGVAVVDSQLELIIGKVVNNEELIHEVRLLLVTYDIKNVAVGSGTNSERISNRIKKQFPEVILTKVTEKYTTMEARKRYFDYHPPTGFLKILPISFRIPRCPYDDFAALVIAERFFKNHQGHE